MWDDFLYRATPTSRCGRFSRTSALAERTPRRCAGHDRACTTPRVAFEDEKLAEEMVAEVEAKRGALPMLAFAVARLWENVTASED